MAEVSGNGADSPSLSTARDGAGPAFELKFLIDEAQARAVEDAVRGRLPLDQHGDPALGGAYRTTTLYLDTAALDVFHRMPPFRRRKYRLRRYGAERRVYLERKTRDEDRVRKRRTMVPEDELAGLAGALSLTTWPGHWFHRQMVGHGLRPACLIGYERTAYAAETTDGPLRLTLDRRLRGSPTGGWEVARSDGGLTFLPAHVVLEFKFRAALPGLFKELLREFRLGPAAVSKYRRCMQAWGVAAGRRGAADA